MSVSAKTLARIPTLRGAHADRARCSPRVIASGICALLLLGMGQGSQAALDPALVSGSVFFNFQPPAGINFGTFDTFSLPGPGGLAEFVASATPSPFLSGEVSVRDNWTGRASGTLIYNMQVVGPSGDVSVKVAVAGGASASSGTDVPFAGFAMKAQWRLEDVNLGLAEVFSEGINTPALQGSFNDSFNHSVELTLQGGHLYRVTMVADAFAGAGSSATPAFASAFIDPVFSFGPGVGSEYSFLFSAGIGNSAPVPEPATWALLATGVLALVLRRTRRAG
jgi:PEP-CTERM motif